MKNPQLEDGYLKISNILIEQLAKIHLSGNETQVLLTVLRKTYGYNKKIDFISLTQFQKATGLSRPSIVEALSKLVGKKVLVGKKELAINAYSLEKDYTLWHTGSEKSTSSFFGEKVVPKKEHTKDILTKDNIYSFSEEKKSPSLTNSGSKMTQDYRTLQAHSKKSKKKTLEPLDYSKLWEMAVRKNISVADVKDIQQAVFDSIEDGDKYKVKNVPLTIGRWIDRGIRMGNIQHVDEIGKMLLDDASPQRLAEIEVVSQIVKKLNERPLDAE